MLQEFKALESTICSKLQTHHSLYEPLKVKDTTWEFIFNKTFNAHHPQIATSWKVESQKIGADISLSNGVRISCKSGKLHSDQRIKISSSRLSRVASQGGEQAVKDYLLATKTDDFIVSLATKKDFDTSIASGRAEYIYSIFDSSVLDYRNVEWTNFGKNQNLRGNTPEGITMTVTKEMGWQLWYHLPVTLALYSAPIIISLS